MSNTIISGSFGQTQQIGKELLAKIGTKRIIALHGGLGSGKTTFAQGLAKGLGINKKIISPTFIISRSYEIPVMSQSTLITNFYHIDLYRINNENETKELGLLELMLDTANLFVIEWPEKIEKLLPDNIINIYFEYIDENKRKITIQS